MPTVTETRPFPPPFFFFFFFFFFFSPCCGGGDSATQESVIVALHVATGAAVGAASGSRLGALVFGPVLHLIGDRVPHRDFHSTRFEIGTGVAGIALLAARRGPLDPATLGAPRAPLLISSTSFRSCVPAEGSSFTTVWGGTGKGLFSAYVQLLLAGVILAALSRSTPKTTQR